MTEEKEFPRMIYPRELRRGDVFRFNGTEYVALNRSRPKAANRNVWVTTRTFFEDYYLHGTSFMIDTGMISIKTQSQIELIDSYAELLEKPSLADSISKKVSNIDNSVYKDPKRLDKFYKKLKDLHKRSVPDWRFGQLMVNFIQRYGDANTMFYWNEDEFIMKLTKFMEDFEIDDDKKRYY